MSRPTTMQQLLPRLQEAARSGNATLVRQMIAWGDSQIAAISGPHPLLRPHRYLSGWRVRRAWRLTARVGGVTEASSLVPCRPQPNVRVTEAILELTPYESAGKDLLKPARRNHPLLLALVTSHIPAILRDPRAAGDPKKGDRAGLRAYDLKLANGAYPVVDQRAARRS